MDWKVFCRSIIVITEKNMRIYYFKGPVVVFGLLFPLIMFLTFFIGRNLDLILFFPGFLGMMLFFTASSVGPLITPWEKREKTYERLVSLPVILESIIIGDLLAGAIFGIAITTIVFVASAVALPHPSCERRAPRAGIRDRIGCICSTRYPPRLADNRQPFEYYDALKPHPPPADLYLRDFHPA